MAKVPGDTRNAVVRWMESVHNGETWGGPP
jgi:hypothetical protein